MEDYSKCLDCEASLIPCTCRPNCPGGMCSEFYCEWNLQGLQALIQDNSNHDPGDEDRS